MLNSWKHIWRTTVIYFEFIQGISISLNYCRKLNKVLSVEKLGLSLRCEHLKWILTYWTSIVNQLTCWLTNWITEALQFSRHSRHSGTQTLEALKALKHSMGTWHSVNWALKLLKALERHLGTWALKELGHLGTWSIQALGHTGTWAIGHLRHSRTQKALGHLGTRGIWSSLFSRLQ